MIAWRRVLPRTVAGQITALVIVAVLLGVGLAFGGLLYLFDRDQTGANREALAAVRAARIAAIAKEATARSNETDKPQWRRMHANGIHISVVPVSELAAEGLSRPPSPLVAAIDSELREDWGLEPLRRSSQSDDDDAVFLAVDDHSALRFGLLPRPGRNFLFPQVVSAVAIVIFIVLFLSIYAIHWIIEPLSSIASAARSFGPAHHDYAELGLEGPHEIVQAAQAINDMRRRVRALMDERTQMLVAISHDLRTPLTRLRLRIERSNDASQRASMLEDVASINNMLRETLAYLREGNHSEAASLVDLPSILETIAAQFVDVGFDVVYQGPDHHTFVGRPQAIERAVNNVVENATKFGAHTDIELRIGDEGVAEIEVRDDGAGVPDELLGRILEPFFKVDSARPAEGRTGFGLGLSIARSIAENHGGQIALANCKPRGFSVRLTLRPLPLGATQEIASVA